MATVIYIQIGFLIYCINFKPFWSSIDNMLLLLTEFSIYMGSLTSLLFTDYVYDPIKRDILGTFMIYMLVLFVFAHLAETILHVLYLLREKLEYIFER